jgi:two-component system copper resistance phosphate regulon response regulator CusR
MKILVMDDAPRAAEYLQQELSEHGYIVEMTLKGTDRLHSAVNGNHNFVLLEIMLPGIDGFPMLSALPIAKQASVLTPAAQANTDDKVKGFDLDVEDYAVKSFWFREVLARVRAPLKRGAKAVPENVLSVANLEIDLVKRRVIRSGNSIDLTPKEFELLVLLMQRSGEVLSRTQIASLVWDINFDSHTNVVEVAIRRLRAKIDDPFDGKLIHTVRGAGYVFEQRA